MLYVSVYIRRNYLMNDKENYVVVRKFNPISPFEPSLVYVRN